MARFSQGVDAVGYERLDQMSCGFLGLLAMLLSNNSGGYEMKSGMVQQAKNREMALHIPGLCDVSFCC